MNMHESSTLSEAMASSARAPARTSALGLALIRLTAWLKDCGDHYSPAAAYDELSRLSDTQLGHRGLSRDIRARYSGRAPGLRQAAGRSDGSFWHTTPVRCGALIGPQAEVERTLVGVDASNANDPHPDMRALQGRVCKRAHCSRQRSIEARDISPWGAATNYSFGAIAAGTSNCTASSTNSSVAISSRSVSFRIELPIMMA